MQRTVVIDVVGLTAELLEMAPNLKKLADTGDQAFITTTTPAVTCTTQATYLTGLPPQQHGCVANGWFFRDLCEIWFWRQSNALMQGEKIWQTAQQRNSQFTCANMFWWYNMYSSVDYSVTPRPMYPADGRKIPDVYADPEELRQTLTKKLGQFPLFNFWGPTASIVSSQWIADASRYVFHHHNPTLMLVYLPHLDYNLQRLGPYHPKIQEDVAEIDKVCGELLDDLQQHARIIVLSEYGIVPVDGAIAINRLLREQGWIRVREELGLELLDAGASTAFAVADHQIAHVYVRDSKLLPKVKSCLEECEDIEIVLDKQQKQQWQLDHPRSGELIALAKPNKWFSYYYWLDDKKAPDFARTVDIHRKPGYDPVELFIDPKITFPLLTVGKKLIKKKLGFRGLFDVISLDTSLVKGSHGRITENPTHGPLIISSEKGRLSKSVLEATEIKNTILSHVFD